MCTLKKEVHRRMMDSQRRAREIPATDPGRDIMIGLARGRAYAYQQVLNLIDKHGTGG